MAWIFARYLVQVIDGAIGTAAGQNASGQTK
jgi:hypothetical protein